MFRVPPEDVEIEEGQASQELKNLTQGIEASDRIRPLAVNPLLLTVIAIVHWNRKRLPSSVSISMTNVSTCCWVSARRPSTSNSAARCRRWMNNARRRPTRNGPGSASGSRRSPCTFSVRVPSDRDTPAAFVRRRTVWPGARFARSQQRANQDVSEGIDRPRSITRETSS